MSRLLDGLVESESVLLELEFLRHFLVFQATDEPVSDMFVLLIFKPAMCGNCVQAPKKAFNGLTRFLRPAVEL